MRLFSLKRCGTRTKTLPLVLVVVLAGCSGKQDAADAPTGGAGARLEQAAVATGVIRDPASTDLNELGPALRRHLPRFSGSVWGVTVSAGCDLARAFL